MRYDRHKPVEPEAMERIGNTQVVLTHYEGDSCTFEIMVLTDKKLSHDETESIKQLLAENYQDAVLEKAWQLEELIAPCTLSVQVDIGFYTDDEAD
jgi:hypothetical protein